MRGSIVKRGKKFHAVLDVDVDERKQKWLCGFTSRTDAERALTEALASPDRGT